MKIKLIQNTRRGTSLVVHWLGLQAVSAGDPGSILVQELGPTYCS